LVRRCLTQHAPRLIFLIFFGRVCPFWHIVPGVFQSQVGLYPRCLAHTTLVWFSKSLCAVLPAPLRHQTVVTFFTLRLCSTEPLTFFPVWVFFFFSLSFSSDFSMVMSDPGKLHPPTKTPKVWGPRPSHFRVSKGCPCRPHSS